jgi:hypothetical protein
VAQLRGKPNFPKEPFAHRRVRDIATQYLDRNVVPGLNVPPPVNDGRAATANYFANGVSAVDESLQRNHAVVGSDYHKHARRESRTRV